MDPVAPELKYFARFIVDVAPPQHVGKTGTGDRKLVPITGGIVSGEISGKIIAGGSDALIIRADGCAELNARYCVQTNDDALIFVQDRGYRHGPKAVMARVAQGEAVDPKTYYFRTCLTLETENPNYQWINQTLFLGSGCRARQQVLIDLYKIN